MRLPVASLCCLVLMTVSAVSSAKFLRQKDNIHRNNEAAEESYQSEQRSLKRAFGYSLGQKASAILLEGALQVYSTVPGTREYMKFGNVRSALKDFYNTNPDDVMFTKLKNGGYGREGEVGDKTIQFKSQDSSGRPSVVLKGRQADKNTGETMIEKVIYYGDPNLLLE